MNVAWFSKLNLTKQDRSLAVVLCIVVVVAALYYCLPAIDRFLLPFHADINREPREKMDVMSLEKAVMVFQVRYGRFPENLDELTRPGPDGQPALIERQGLIDPWGNSYRYDPNQLHPSIKKPLIWSDGPPGKSQPVSNWK